MLWRDLKVWQVWGSNTDVGKTVISTILCKALAQRVAAKDILYFKPVQTGPSFRGDRLMVKNNVEGIFEAGRLHYQLGKSPHLAARAEPLYRQNDNEVNNDTRRVLLHAVKIGTRYALIETAGGVLSPSPTNTLQADAFRPLRLPAILVGDSRLGGIGSTISAFESLHMRGYDIDSVILFNDPEWENFEFLKQHFSDKHGISTYALPMPPPKVTNLKADEQSLKKYIIECSKSTIMLNIINTLNHKHFSRVSALTSMPARAESIIWHPFRQHALPQNIIAIDSAHNDLFTAYNQETDPAVTEAAESNAKGINAITRAPHRPLTTRMYDASASWWTQGLGHGNPQLALTAAHAAGRYGHVMFANAVHQPALDLCYNLLETLGNPRLSRVFFTDNGSTGMEVAVKMALRASCQRYGWDKEDSDNPVGVLGIKGSYHGDTIGVMNCSEPNTFNEKVDWYQPWGFWFDPPQVSMKEGKWQIAIPPAMADEKLSQSSNALSFDSINSVFDFGARESDAAFYRSYIVRTVKHLTQTQKRRFGALIMEPVLMGAGGMIFVDPLFQRTLISTIREDPILVNPSYTAPNKSTDAADWTGLPVIADEVFTGLYRLGRASSSSFLSDNPLSSSTLPMDIAPDISVHAKLLTGGLLPLAVTTASNAIFNTFLSPSKADALLHGHSYTAHPMGCAVANKSLEQMKRLHENEDMWKYHRGLWSAEYHASTNKLKTEDLLKPEYSLQHHARFTAGTAQDAANGETGKSDESADFTPDNSTTSPASPPTQTPTPDLTSTNLPTIPFISSTASHAPYSFWSPAFLTNLSSHVLVENCFALGTVLALTLKSDPMPSITAGVKQRMRNDFKVGTNATSTTSTTSTTSPTASPAISKSKGYTSPASQTLQSRLLTHTPPQSPEQGSAIHARTLGDVIYFMTSLTMSPLSVRLMEQKVLGALQEELEEKMGGVVEGEMTGLGLGVESGEGGEGSRGGCE